MGKLSAVLGEFCKSRIVDSVSMHGALGIA